MKKTNNMHKKNNSFVDISSGRISEKTKFPLTAKILIAISCVLILICGCVLAYFYSFLRSFKYDEDSAHNELHFDNYQQNQEDIGSIELHDEYPLSHKAVINVLVFGIEGDSRYNNGRSDAILLLSLNVGRKKIKLTSIMRDAWVKIPGYPEDRINAAYSFCGAKLACETVERNFGISIDRYASVNFSNFVKIIDNIGGIEMNLSASEVAYINKFSGDKHTLRGSGRMRLTGLQALHHSRNRNSIGSDFDRVDRQRDVTITIIEQFKNANLAQITKTIFSIAPMITTNFSQTEITKLVGNSLTYLKFGLEQFRLPTDDNVQSRTINQKSVLVISDIKKARRALADFIYEDLIKH